MTAAGIFILAGVVVAIVVLFAGGFALGHAIARRDLRDELFKDKNQEPNP